MDVEGPCGGLALRKMKTFYSATKNIHNFGETPKSMQSNTPQPREKKIRLICMVYSHSQRHNSVLRALAETYAPRCDGYMVASNRTELRLGVPHGAIALLLMQQFPYKLKLKTTGTVSESRLRD
jgi:hypothetical protein